MASASLKQWRNQRQAALDELEEAHGSVGGRGPGRRYATQQINQAYAVLLASQFQGFCRELHSECADHLANAVMPTSLKQMFHNALVENRSLERGNANPGSIGADFNRFGLVFWDEVRDLDKRNKARRDRVIELNTWRNAIAHQDFDPVTLGRSYLRLQLVREWRQACDQLASAFDTVMHVHIQSLTGTAPW